MSRRLQIMFLTVLKQQPLFLSNITACSVSPFIVRGERIQLFRHMSVPINGKLYKEYQCKGYV
jgi:hypothetical protein